MKNILNEIKEIQAEIDNKKKYSLHLQEILKSLSSTSKDTIQQRTEILMTEKTMIEKEISTLKEMQSNSQIKLNKHLAEKIKDFRIYSVMMQRYVLMKKFSEIQTDLHFSESVIFRLHRKGLKILGLK